MKANTLLWRAFLKEALFPLLARSSPCVGGKGLWRLIFARRTGYFANISSLGGTFSRLENALDVAQCRSNLLFINWQKLPNLNIILLRLKPDKQLVIIILCVSLRNECNQLLAAASRITDWCETEGIKWYDPRILKISSSSSDVDLSFADEVWSRNPQDSLRITVWNTWNLPKVNDIRWRRGVGASNKGAEKPVRPLAD